MPEAERPGLQAPSSLVRDGPCLWRRRDPGLGVGRVSVLSRVRLCDLMDCSPPGSSVHGILQARILEWVAISSSRGLPHPGIEPRSPALRAYSLLFEPPGEALL